MFPFPHSGTAYRAVRAARLLWCAVASVLTFRPVAIGTIRQLPPVLYILDSPSGEPDGSLRYGFGTRTRSGLVQSTRCRPASGSHSRFNASRGIEPLPLSSWPYAVCKVRRCKLNLQHSYGHTKWPIGVHENRIGRSSPPARGPFPPRMGRCCPGLEKRGKGGPSEAAPRKERRA